MLKSVSLEIADLDPELALELFLEIKVNDGDDTGQRVFQSLAKHDWEQAIESATAMENVAIQKQAIEGLLTFLGKSRSAIDLDQVRSLLVLAQEAGAHRGNYDGMLRKLDPETRNDLVRAYPDLLSKSVENLVESLGWFDPEAGARMASSLPPSVGRDKGVQRAVMTWAQSDPDTAAAWVREMDFGPGRDTAIQNLVHTWSRYDAAAARSWIETLDVSGDRRIASEEYIRSLAVRDGASAWDLATATPDGDDRAALQKLALKGWLQRDPAAARAALSALPSPDADLEETFGEALEHRDQWQRFLTGDVRGDEK